jgi:hypothetical protein
MSKMIPPPPPKPRTKRARNNATPATIAVTRLRSKTYMMDVHAHDRHDFDPDHGPSGGQTAPGGRPADLGSNFPAVTGALGMRSEKSAQRLIEGDKKKMEYVGRTSKLPECGATPRNADGQKRSEHDR